MNKKISLNVEVERLKAQVEMLSKAREALNDRLSTLSERIGELRNALVEQEREYSNLDVEIRKTIELVNEIRPEEIMKKISKFEAKMDILKAKIEGNETLMNKVIEELKEMRRAFIHFKNLEEVVKLAEDFKKDLLHAKKLEAKISKYAGKTEGIFFEMEKKFKDFLMLGKIIDDIRERFKTIVREFDKLRLEFVDVVKKSELAELEQRIENRFNRLEELSKELEEKKEELEEIILNSEELTKIKERVSVLVEEKKFISDKLQLLEKVVDESKTINNRLKKLENKTYLLEGELNKFSTKKVVEKLKSRLDEKFFDLDKLSNNVSNHIMKLNNLIKKANIEKLVGLKSEFKIMKKKIYEIEKRQKEIIEVLELLVRE